MKMEIPKNTVIHCPTEELADKVLELLRAKGYIVNFKGNMFSSYKGNLCFSCNCYLNKQIGYSGLDFYIREGLQIVEAEDFLKQYNKKEMKKIKVEVPEGMEVDLEKSIINEHEVSIVYKAIKKEEYSDVTPKNTPFILRVNTPSYCFYDKIGSENQMLKIFAINQLQNIANYYNGDKEVNFNDESKKYFLYYYAGDNEYRVQSTLLYNNGGVHFLNKQDAQSVIDNPNFREILDKIYK